MCWLLSLPLVPVIGKGSLDVPGYALDDRSLAGAWAPFAARLVHSRGASCALSVGPSIWSDDLMLRNPPKECPLAAALAEQLRASRAELTAHWLERIAARVAIEPNRIFPTDELLDHVPLLIEGIAAYVEDPTAEVTTDTPVVGKAMELGALRHAQGFDAYEILKEYEMLGGILFHYLSHAVDEMPDPCEKSELLACGQRLFRAITIIQQTTTTHFLRLAQEQVAEREERIRTFNRVVSHEIKNRIGAVLGAADVLHEVPEMPTEQRSRFVDLIRRNTRAMQESVTNVLAVSRTAADARQQRHVRLPEAAQEAVRQVREAAQAAGVSEAGPHGKRETVVRVRDNGFGVPPEKREHLFERFFRAHETVTEAEGTGLGLSIVREAAESIGGRAGAEFPDEGSVFAFAVPERRKGERRGGDTVEEEEDGNAPAAADGGQLG